jgi:hypothetical protein
MRMYLAVAGINYQPFEVGLVNEHLKEFFPYSLLAPADKTLVDGSPLAVFKRHIAPRRSCPEHPEYCINKEPVVFCHSSPLSALAWEMRF